MTAGFDGPGHIPESGCALHLEFDMALSFMAAAGIGILAWAATLAGMQFGLGILLPFAAFLVFVAGFCWRIVNWAKLPVPFPITTTGGQQQSLPWIRHSCLEAPRTRFQVGLRMALEVLLFRSLFRNTSAQLRQETPEGGSRLVYWSSKWLWVFAILFHYAFLVVFLRHFRFFIGDVPVCLNILEFLDGLMQVGSTRVMMSGIALLAGALFLLGRRMADPKLRYFSLPNDYFPLFLILGVILSGLAMRYIAKTDIASAKVVTMALVTFSWSGTDLAQSLREISPLFFIHVGYVSALLIYFPFSKLMHMGGIFLSPTRNLPNNSREVMHVNPWNGPKKFRTYAEYEDDFRDAMAEAGLPLEKQPDPQPE